MASTAHLPGGSPPARSQSPLRQQKQRPGDSAAPAPTGSRRRPSTKAVVALTLAALGVAACGAPLLLPNATARPGAPLSMHAAAEALAAVVADRRSATLFVWCMGQFAGAWTLLLLESRRAGNASRLCGWGLAPLALVLQPLGFAAWIPVYLVLHLAVSSVARPFPGPYAHSVLLVDRAVLHAVPVAVALGLVAPACAMALPGLRTLAVVAWRLAPVTVVLGHAIMRALFRAAGAASREPRPSTAPLLPATRRVAPVSQAARYMASARLVFVFAQAACVLATILAAALALPPRLTRNSWHALAVLLGQPLPAIADAEPAIASPMPQAAYVLACDMCPAFAALLIWALFLYANARSSDGIDGASHHLPVHVAGQPGGSRLWGWRRAKELGRSSVVLLGWMLVGGPVSAAAHVLKARDGVVRQKFKMGV